MIAASQISNLAFSSDSANQAKEINQLKNKIIELVHQVMTKDTILDEAKKSSLISKTGL